LPKDSYKKAKVLEKNRSTHMLNPLSVLFLILNLILKLNLNLNLISLLFVSCAPAENYILMSSSAASLSFVDILMDFVLSQFWVWSLPQEFL